MFTSCQKLVYGIKTVAVGDLLLAGFQLLCYPVRYITLLHAELIRTKDNLIFSYVTLHFIQIQTSIIVSQCSFEFFFFWMCILHLVLPSEMCTYISTWHVPTITIHTDTFSCTHILGVAELTMFTCWDQPLTLGEAHLHLVAMRSTCWYTHFFLWRILNTKYILVLTEGVTYYISIKIEGPPLIWNQLHLKVVSD